MTEPHHDESNRDRDENDDEMRRLLASSRVEDTTPPEVVSRLDDVLATLVAERQNPPVDLAVERTQRRRRWIGVAAAAVVVVAAGATLPQLVGDPGSTDTASTAMSEHSTDTETLVGRPEISSESLDRDVTAYVASLEAASRESESSEAEHDRRADSSADEAPAPARPLDELAAAERDSGSFSGRESTPQRNSPATDSQCGWAGRGDVHPALFDGTPADLVLQTGAGGRLVARIVTCAGGTEPTVARTVVVRPGVRPVPTS